MSNDTEAHRHACEVRYVEAMPARRQLDYLQRIKERRGLDAYERLERDTRAKRSAEMAVASKHRRYYR